MEDHSLDSDKDEIMTIFFDLVNPYRAGPFHLIKVKRASHSSPRGEPASFSGSPPPKRSSMLFSSSPPTQRGLHTPAAGSPIGSPRNNSSVVTSMPQRSGSFTEARRDSGSSSPRGGSLESGSSFMMHKASKEPELSDRSSNTLKSM